MRTDTVRYQDGHPVFADYTPEALERASRSVPEGVSICMVNLLRFHAWATYEAPDHHLDRCTGRDAYFRRYASAFGRIAQGADYGLVWRAEVRSMIVAPEAEGWDEIVIVRYASFSVLRRVLEDPAYVREADPHRRAAVADWRFMLTTPSVPVPAPAAAG